MHYLHVSWTNLFWTWYGRCRPAGSADNPFYLLTVFFFANSSEKLHTWFLGTELYKKHLDSFVKKRGMLLSIKLSVIFTVSLMMSFGLFMMSRKGIWIPCIILVVVWICHIIYFVFFVKTITKDEQVAITRE